jgi:hypothetical protein
MMYNPSGFDAQGLDMSSDLGDPRRQERLPGGYATQGQAVSAPYAEANMRAAEKTNPINAASQEPGKAFLDSYVQKSGMEQGETAFDIMKFFNFGRQGEQGDKNRRGQNPGNDTGFGLADDMGNRTNRQTQMICEVNPNYPMCK